jgi:FkbM family methyltransferase
MLIKFKDLIEKYKINVKGVLHIGAHHAEEAESYESCDVKQVIWVEADSNTFGTLTNIIKKYPFHKAYCFAASNSEEDEVDFHVASNGESSSILKMDKHLQHHPHISIVGNKKVKTKIVDNFIKEENINLKQYNFLNLDIQGAELMALKGMKESFKDIDYIYSEVNTANLYENCPMIEEIDEYLSQFGFERKETSLTQYEWGDAFYIKKK